MYDYTEFTLDNGLRCVHAFDPGTAMVAVNVLYDVGSRDEAPGLTGLAHLMEHLMFAGSRHVPDFDAAIERAGGHDNAWTSNDFTDFHSEAPACNLDTLLWLESDRMEWLALSEQSLKVQRSVVIEEFKQTHLNRPYGDLSHHLRRLLYTRHPYRYPTIGKEPAHIERMTLDDVQHFYRTHYAPNNAVLAIVGNVTLEQARHGAYKWFGPLPARPVAPRRYPPEPAIEAPRALTLCARVPQSMVVTAWPMAAYGERGYIEADLITDILASGRSSRLYRRLTMADELFSEAEASISGSEEAGFLMLQGRLSDPTPQGARRAVERLTAELRALTQVQGPGAPDGISPGELEAAVNRYESRNAFSMLSLSTRAYELALAVMHGESPASRIAAYRNVTAHDIARTTREILNPTRQVTLTYLPDGNPSTEAAGA